MESQIIQIQSKIFGIRGQKVMIDRDLAQLYGIETKKLNQAVKRNIARFAGDDFMFQLTNDEIADCSRSQIVTLKKGRGQHIKYAPFAFTELGIAMLSSVLNSPTAIEINRGIMRAFVAIRQFLAIPPVERLAVLEHEVQRLAATMEEAFAEYNTINEDSQMQFALLSKSLTELQAYKQIINKPRKLIGYTADHPATNAIDVK
jgi:hypothetical protein